MGVAGQFFSEALEEKGVDNYKIFQTTIVSQGNITIVKEN